MGLPGKICEFENVSWHSFMAGKRGLYVPTEGRESVGKNVNIIKNRVSLLCMCLNC